MVRALSIFDKEVGGVDQKDRRWCELFCYHCREWLRPGPWKRAVCANPGMLSLQLGDLGM